MGPHTVTFMFPLVTADFVLGNRDNNVNDKRNGGDNGTEKRKGEGHERRVACRAVGRHECKYQCHKGKEAC
jgi:hypothetical protein